MKKYVDLRAEDIAPREGGESNGGKTLPNKGYEPLGGEEREERKVRELPFCWLLVFWPMRVLTTPNNANELKGKPSIRFIKQAFTKKVLVMVHPQSWNILEIMHTMWIFLLR